MRVGIAADHGGFEMKEMIKENLSNLGYEMVDFGASSLNPNDDYPDFVIPLSKEVAKGRLQRGIAICGSGVGACITANKFPNIRAGLTHDIYSARQGVEDDNMNIICIGGRVIGYAAALSLVKIFLEAKFKGEYRYQRRLDKIKTLENRERI